MSAPGRDNAGRAPGEVGKTQQQQHHSTRLPAYGKALRTALTAGMEPFHGIAVYLDQRPPKSPLCAPLACFQDTDPDQLDWSLCSGRDVHVANASVCEPGRLARLIDALSATRPRRLQIHRADAPTEFVILGGDT